MPIYEYECPKCGRFDVIQKSGAAPLKANPECDCKDCPHKAKRIISAPAVHFKGAGFYKTDYCGSSPISSSGEAGGDNAKKKSTVSDEKKSSETTPTKSCGPSCGCH